MHRVKVRDIITDVSFVMRQICHATVIVMRAENILQLAHELIFAPTSPFNTRATRNSEARHKFQKWWYGLHDGIY